MAKDRHAEEFGAEAPINRVKIRKFKKEFKKKIFGSTQFNTRTLKLKD